eukprot:1156363-Pelagomonas_calceolata.AAC.5
MLGGIPESSAADDHHSLPVLHLHERKHAACMLALRSSASMNSMSQARPGAIARATAQVSSHHPQGR